MNRIDNIYIYIHMLMMGYLMDLMGIVVRLEWDIMGILSDLLNHGWLENLLEIVR